MNNDLLIKNSNLYKLLEQSKDQALINVLNNFYTEMTIKQKITTVEEAEKIYNQLPDDIVYDKEKLYDQNTLNNLSDIESAKKYLQYWIACNRILRLRCFFFDKGYKDKKTSSQDEYVEFSKMINPDDKFKMSQSECDILKQINKATYNVEKVGDMIYFSIYSAFAQVMQSIFDVDCRKKYITETFLKFIKICRPENWILFFIASKYIMKADVILKLLASEDRYHFFVELHRSMANNLQLADQKLFHDYLNSCKNKLQSERNKYSYFYQREWISTGIVIFGIIASTAVLTIYFLEIYAATWFFWLGIVGVVLTVAVGIRLFFCLKENLKEGKTIAQKIAEIDRAIEVYDFNKIRDFKESELEKILTIETGKDKIIFNDDEIDITKQHDDVIK